MTINADDIQTIIKEEHKYDSLPSKAVNKMMYLVHQECEDRGITSDIPYFWYMFGVVSDDPSLNSTNASKSSTVLEIDEAKLRNVVNDVLQQYYRSDLESITDSTYNDAPYAVQQEWRHLDKLIRTRHSDSPDFYEVDPSWEEIWDGVESVYDHFPLDEFQEFEMDLLTWYSTMTRELNTHEPEVERLKECNESFWRIFSLSVAEMHRHQMSKKEVRESIEIESFEKAREYSRQNLASIEKESLDESIQNEEASTTTKKATDEVVRSTVEISQ